MFKKTKKEIYDESLFDKRTHINGETAIKPYHYFRNGTIHVRYTVDRCMRLTPGEVERLKADITASPAEKQRILSDMWNFLSVTVGREVIHDGIAELEKQIKEYRKNGRKD